MYCLYSSSVVSEASRSFNSDPITTILDAKIWFVLFLGHTCRKDLLNIEQSKSIEHPIRLTKSLYCFNSLRVRDGRGFIAGVCSVQQETGWWGKEKYIVAYCSY